MKSLEKLEKPDIDSFLLSAPRVAGVIAGSLSLATVKKAIRLGADLIEVRIDTFENREPALLADILSKIKSDKAASRTPILLTVRSVKEGGKIHLTDKERLALLTALMPYADLIDIELSSGRLLKDVINLKKKRQTKLIVSYHNFTSTPGLAGLRQIIKKGRAAGADYVKIAATANDKSSVKRLAGLLTAADGLIIIAMGDYGRPSRAFFPLIGSLITFGSISTSTAPGQMSVSEIKKSWKFLGI